MIEFEGKVAIVTGAGKGIGKSTAAQFAREGAQVVAFDLDLAATEDTVAAIEKDGGQAIAVNGDVRVEGDAQASIAAAVDTYGGVDVLSNNAGVVRYGEVPDFIEQDWDFVLDINLKGPYLMARHAIPEMRRRGGGSIINTASVQAFATQRTVTAYSASKGGVVAMTKTMALDHAKDNIRVNAIAPGSVRTPMLIDAAKTFSPEDPDAALEEWGSAHPIGRLIEPQEVAEVILFLAGPRASAVTGATLLVDGGLVCGLPL